MADRQSENLHDDSALYPNYHRMQKDIEKEMEKIDAIFAKRFSDNVTEDTEGMQKTDCCKVTGPNASFNMHPTRLASGSSNDYPEDDESFLKLEGERLLMEFGEIEKSLWTQCDVLRTIEKELQKSSERAEENRAQEKDIAIGSGVREEMSTPPTPHSKIAPDCVRALETERTHAECEDRPANFLNGTTNPVASAARELIAQVLSSKRYEVGDTERGANVGDRYASARSSRDFENGMKVTVSLRSSEVFDEESTWMEGDSKEHYPADAAMAMTSHERTVETRRPSTSKSEFIVYNDDDYDDDYIDDYDDGNAEFGYNYYGHDNSDIN